MDFTSEQNVEDSNQSNTSDKPFYVAGEASALAELVGNQVYLTSWYLITVAVLFQYFHDGFFPALDFILPGTIATS